MVVHAEKDGLVGIQLLNSAAQDMEDFLGKFDLKTLQKEQPPVTAENISMDKNYLTIYSVDDRIYRVKIMKLLKDDFVKVTN